MKYSNQQFGVDTLEPQPLAHTKHENYIQWPIQTWHRVVVTPHDGSSTVTIHCFDTT